MRMGARLYVNARRIGQSMSSRGRKTAASHASATRRRTWLAIAGVVAIGLVVAVLMLRPAVTPALDDESDPTLGSPEAAVTVYYFADFQCPYCRSFDLDRLPELKASYVDTGQVRLVFKDFPIIGEDSWTAAEASQHVWRTTPERYWEWHRAIYEAQGAERSGWASADNLVSLSERMPGVDAAGMRAALASHENLEEARMDARQGRDHGVRGTPTLVIDGRAVNALDPNAVERALKEALAP